MSTFMNFSTLVWNRISFVTSITVLTSLVVLLAQSPSSSPEIFKETIYDPQLQVHFFGPSIFFFGDSIKAKIRVSNNGTIPLNAVEIKLTSPALPNLRYFSPSISPDLTDPDYFVWRIADLQPQEADTINFKISHVEYPSLPADTTTTLTCSLNINQQQVLSVSRTLNFIRRARPDFSPEITNPTQGDTLTPHHPFFPNVTVYETTGTIFDSSLHVYYYLDNLKIPLYIDTVEVFQGSSVSTGVWKNPIRGDHTLYVKVNKYNRIIEHNTSNNIDSINVTVAINELNVNVLSVGYTDSIDVNGQLFDGAFPTPILARVSVHDQNGWPITGLADSTQWITETDTTNVNIPAKQIWSRLKEYHKKDHSRPRNNLIDRFHVTEVVRKLPLTTALVMDVSSSMGGEHIQLAKEAASQYLDSMKPGDTVGIIHFENSYSEKGFSNDKNQLEEWINQANAGGGTRLYKALIETIKKLSTHDEQTVIIAYTDGDTHDKELKEEVIKRARSANVPIFLIGIGELELEYLNNMSDISKWTGGYFLNLADINELAQVYAQLGAIFQSYYLIAYNSTDHSRDGTWRQLDVTVQHLDLTGNNVNVYRAPFPDNDIFVEKSSFTDSLLLVGNQKYPCAFEQDTITYTITLENFGSETATDITVTDLLPQDISYVVATDVEPIINNDSLQWTIAKLRAGQNTAIQYKAVINNDILDFGVKQIINPVIVTCEFDTSVSNNTSVDTLYVIEAEPQAQYVCPDIEHISLEHHPIITSYTDSIQGTIRVRIKNNETTTTPSCQLVMRHSVSPQKESPHSATLKHFFKVNIPSLAPGATFSYRHPTLWYAGQGGDYLFSGETTIDTALYPNANIIKKQGRAMLQTIPKWIGTQVKIATKDTFDVTIRRYSKIDIPLIPMVFFARQSSSVEKCYNDTTAVEAILPIVAERIKVLNDSLILKGYVDSLNERSMQLALERSLAVKNELENLGVNPKLIVIDSTVNHLQRRLPKESSSSKTQEYINHENRRVELLAVKPGNNYSLFAPREIKVLEQISDNDTIKFNANIQIYADELVDWRLNIMATKDSTVIDSLNDLKIDDEKKSIKGTLYWIAADDTIKQSYNCAYIVRDRTSDGTLREFRSQIDTFYLNESITVLKDQIFSIFNFNTSDTPFNFYQEEEIDSLFQYLTSLNSSFALSIVGHTDIIGPKTKNETLSKDRADTVLNTLVRRLEELPWSSHKSIDGLKTKIKRLSPSGLASEKPLAIKLQDGTQLKGDNSTPVGRNLNRRVVITVIEQK